MLLPWQRVMWYPDCTLPVNPTYVHCSLHTHSSRPANSDLNCAEKRTRWPPLPWQRVMWYPDYTLPVIPHECIVHFIHSARPANSDLNCAEKRTRWPPLPWQRIMWYPDCTLPVIPHTCIVHFIHVHQGQQIAIWIVQSRQDDAVTMAKGHVILWLYFTCNPTYVHCSLHTRSSRPANSNLNCAEADKMTAVTMAKGHVIPWLYLTCNPTYVHCSLHTRSSRPANSDLNCAEKQSKLPRKQQNVESDNMRVPIWQWLATAQLNLLQLKKAIYFHS